MLMGADVGGTKTLVGLYDGDGERPVPVAVESYATLEYGSLDEMIAAFVGQRRIERVDAVCVGAAGPVKDGVRANLTNVPWTVDISPIAARLGSCPAEVINDLEAIAYAVDVLDESELKTLQRGRPDARGNAAVIAAGTGLGEALLHNVNGRFRPSASEGGHADFPARTAREIALLERLLSVYGRVDVERVVSGPGLVNVAGFTHDRTDGRCATDLHSNDAAAEVAAAALARRCAACVEALDIFVEAYGAEAGNMALRSVATSGVYVGGGIAPKILRALETGGFINAFRQKPPMADLLMDVPVRVILNPEAGLLGAAVRAQALAAR